MKYRWWVFGCLLWCVVGMVPIAYASETHTSELPARALRADILDQLLPKLDHARHA